MIKPNNRNLFLLSLRMLSQFRDGLRPSGCDLHTLRHQATVSEANLPLDQLCCALIRRELGSAMIVEATA